MKKQKLVGCLALALLALIVQPGLVSAQTAVLYEVTETMKLSSIRNGEYRSASAALFGWVSSGSSICPTWLVQALGQTHCSITARAHDSVNLATGRGPVDGTFQIVIAGDNDVDAPELVILEGRLNGRVDLSPVLDQVPLGSIKGTWRAKGLRDGVLAGLEVRGSFTGTFRLPFVSPLDPSKTPLYLLDPTTQQVVPVQANQYSLGVPTVMLEITFVERD